MIDVNANASAMPLASATTSTPHEPPAPPVSSGALGGVQARPETHRSYRVRNHSGFAGFKDSHSSPVPPYLLRQRRRPLPSRRRSLSLLARGAFGKGYHPNDTFGRVWLPEGVVLGLASLGAIGPGPSPRRNTRDNGFGRDVASHHSTGPDERPGADANASKHHRTRSN